MPQKTVRILGTHGVPAAYGGFETAAENIAIYLVNKGWRVIVYCQEEGRKPLREDMWFGIHRVLISTKRSGWLGTSDFDLKSTRHACRYRDPCLIFGYNTAIFNVLQRMHHIPMLINTDGMEWSRKRWGPARQSILYLNERIALLIGDHLIADHPVIETYLHSKTRPAKVTMIAYGARRVNTAQESVLRSFELTPHRYLTIICRPIPENSVLELVKAFSEKRRDCKLAILGEYDPSDDYQRAVIESASQEVDFLGSQYLPTIIDALRYYSLGYLHGHTVGGTNPSLVEAMAAGNPIIANDNVYNRWVAGDSAIYFDSLPAAEACIDNLLASPGLQDKLRAAAIERYNAEFTWEHIGTQYEHLLDNFYARTSNLRKN